MDLAIDPAKIVYLDDAGTTLPKPRDVLEAMLDTYACFGVNPGRSGYDRCLVAGDLVVGSVPPKHTGARIEAAIGAVSEIATATGTKTRA